MINLIKKAAKLIIPTKYHRFIRKNQNVSTNRFDALKINIDDNLFIEVSWRNDKFGAGSSASLYIFDDEVLRFDCFGKEKGHFHASTAYKSRIFNDRIHFAEESIEEQINRSHFEVVNNLPFYLGINPFKKIRNFKIDTSSLNRAADEMKNIMQKYRIENFESKSQS